MKSFSDRFRENLREDRQLNAVVSYKTDETISVLTTQKDKKLLSENKDFITTEKGTIEYNKESINSINPLFNSNLFKTTCKSVQIDCNTNIPVKNWISVKIGAYDVEEDNYEYLNFGKYLIVEEPTFQADTNSYLITAYDKMIESMIKYDDNPLNVTFPIKHKDLVIAICEKFEWDYILEDYPNYDKEIKKDFYKGQNLTYRDVLDDLNGVCGGSFMFDTRNVFILKRLTETNQIVDDNDLKDINVDFKEKYGIVNSLTITTNKNVVLNNREDEQSIEENGKTEFNIDDNYILNYSTDEFIDNIFNEIKGLEYYLYDVDSTGLLIFDPLDIFAFRHNGIDYKTIMLNDDIKLSQGLVETTYIEKEEAIEKEYIKTDKDKNKLNNALISLDKANAEIVLKVDSNGRIAQVRLDGDAEEGTVIDIDADQVNLTAEDVLNLIAGNEINLTSKNITINSDNFKVDKNGKIIAKEGEIAGYTIVGNTLKGKDVGMCGLAGEEYAFWAGNTTGHEAPFRVGHDGLLKASNVEITGGNIKLNSPFTNPKFIIGTNSNNDYNTYIAEGQISLGNASNTNGSILIDNINSSEDNDTVPTIWLNEKNSNVNHTTISSRSIDTPVLYQHSLAEMKKNFQKLDNALEIIKNTDIYKYNLKNENDNKKKHIGAVIGDKYKCSEEIINNERTGIDQYSMIAVVYKAIQEQQEQIEELKEMIKNG